MLYVWLIPALVILLVLLAVFYVVVCRRGVPAKREDGRCLVGHSEEKDEAQS